MKTDRFRIIPVAPDKYIVKRKGRFFWRTEQSYASAFCETVAYARKFSSKEDARTYIDDLLATEAATRKHLAQPVEEYPA